MRILLELGGMRSGYFIDHVDTEWCMRARSIGYQLIGVPNALMEHSLGDEVKRIWFLYLRNVSYHAPFRDYYMFRNTLLLLRDTRIGFAWQIVLLFRLFQFAGYFLIFASKRLSRLRCMLYGLSHGAMGISGRFDMKTGRCTTIARTKFDPQ
jgi:rhamnosyltransferase